MKIINIKILLSLLVMLWSFQANASREFNIEFSNGTFNVEKIDYKKRLIYANQFEFTYNAKTKFIAGDEAVKASARDIKKGSQIRLKISNKVKSKRRPLLSEITIRRLR